MKKQENDKDRKIRNQRKEIERLIEKNKQLESYILHGYYASNPDWEVAGEDVIVNGIFNPKPEKNKAVFTNCLEEDFTEGWMVKNFYYCVRKSNLRVYKLNGLSYQLRGNESWSECFKTEESAEKWKEQYKTNKLKDGFVFDEDKKEFRELGMEEISCKIEDLNSFNRIYSHLPDKIVLYIKVIDKTSFALLSNTNTQKHCISEGAFIRIMKNNNN